MLAYQSVLLRLLLFSVDTTKSIAAAAAAATAAAAASTAADDAATGAAVVAAVQLLSTVKSCYTAAVHAVLPYHCCTAWAAAVQMQVPLTRPV